MSLYLKHFGLKAPPFATSPDPEFAYQTREHQLAVTKVAYSVEERRGLFLLTGPSAPAKPPSRSCWSRPGMTSRSATPSPT